MPRTAAHTFRMLCTTAAVDCGAHVCLDAIHDAIFGGQCGVVCTTAKNPYSNLLHHARFTTLLPPVPPLIPPLVLPTFVLPLSSGTADCDAARRAALCMPRRVVANKRVLGRQWVCDTDGELPRVDRVRGQCATLAVGQVWETRRRRLCGGPRGGVDVGRHPEW